MSNFEMNQYSLEQLEVLQKELRDHLREKKTMLQKKSQVIKAVMGSADVKRICKRYDFDIEYLFVSDPIKEVIKSVAKTNESVKAVKEVKKAKTVVRKRGKVPPKYILNGQTWTGRGIKPKVFAEYVADGGEMDDLLISNKSVN